jgi:small-conductance mechanosensitive channel
MNRSVNLGIFAIALSAFLTHAAPAVGQTSTTDAIKGYTVEKKNEAAAHAKKLVSDLDAKIKALDAQVSSDTSAAKADGQRQLKELKATRDKTAKKADELGQASAASWDSVKTGFADSYKDLQKAYDDTAAKLRK